MAYVSYTAALECIMDRRAALAKEKEDVKALLADRAKAVAESQERLANISLALLQLDAGVKAVVEAARQAGAPFGRLPLTEAVARVPVATGDSQ